MSLREMMRRLVSRARDEAGVYERLEAEGVDYSYRIFWTKQAREWGDARRARVAEAVRGVMARPGFERNHVERRYEVPALGDGLAHSGASLLALDEVLGALDAYKEINSE